MTSLIDLTGATTLVTGASRGFGRATAGALCASGARVVGLARDPDDLAKAQAELGDSFIPVTGDAADPAVAERLITEHRPRVLILNAGAIPITRPVHEHTWETFSRNWESDVKHAFSWIKLALTLPLERGSIVVAVSSGAALGGSPISGGYAGAKATIRFLAAYAAEESTRNDLGITFLSVLPTMTPGTGIGESGVEGYSKRQGVDRATFIERFGRTPTPEETGQAIVDLARNPAHEHTAYRLTLDGPVGL